MLIECAYGRDRGAHTTFRQAWVEVQRIVGEEARVHQLLGQRLESLVGVLSSFKDSKVSDHTCGWSGG
jgi:hypothetical protein